MQQQQGSWQQQPGWGPPQPPTPYAPLVPSPPASGDPEVSAIDALKSLFQDNNWQNNLLIGSVYSLIPILGQLALLGWHCEIMQRLVRKHPQPIPKLEFSDLMTYFSRGVSPFCVSLILSLPLSFLITGILFLGLLGGGALAAAVGEPAIIIAVYVLLFVLLWVLSLGISVLFQAAMTRAEASEEIGYAVSPGAIFSYAGKVFWKSLIAYFVYGLLAMVLMMVGYMLCFVGLYPAMVIMAVGGTHLRYQLYQVYLARGGEPLQLKAPVAIPSEQQAAQRSQPYQQPPPGPYGPPPGPYGQPPQGPYGGYPGR